MRHTIYLLVLAALFCAPMFNGPALAANTPLGAGFTHETPLIVIRFNQPHLDYAMPLYHTISRALEVKPGAVFDVVSIAQRARKSENQSYFDTLAMQNTHKVLSTLHQMGLPAERISLVNAIDDINASEVRIFVH